MVALCPQTQAQRLVVSVLFLLHHVSTSQITILDPARFLATACNSSNEATAFPTLCSLGPGNWSISPPPPATSLTHPQTIISGSIVAPQRVGTADTTEYGTWLNLPSTISEPLLHIPPNATLTLSNMKITGALLQAQLQSGLPSPGAIALSPGSRLQLLNIKILTSCQSLAAYQTFACQQQLPSPSFNIGYGTLTFVSYTMPALEFVNVTVTCDGSTGESLPAPVCLSVVAASGADVLAVMGSRRPELSFMGPIMRIFVYIATNISLVPAATAAKSGAAPPPPPLISVLMSQDLLYVSGSSDTPTWLDLSGSESLIRLVDNAQVVLQDLTLLGLPMGPARTYPLGLMRVPVWTFDFQRISVGGVRKRLTLRNLTLALTPAEVAALAHDLQEPGLPTPAGDPWVPACVSNLVIFGDAELGGPAAGAAASAAPTPASTSDGLSLFIRKASTAFGSMLYMENVLLDATFTSSEAGVLDWRQEPLCQLLPLHPPTKDDENDEEEPPHFPIDARVTVFELQGQFIFPTKLTPYYSKPYFVMTQDSALLVGPPPPDGTITFSQLQSYITGISVLLGDPVRPRLLNTYQMPAAVNLRRPGTSLTLRRLVLTNLSFAGVHPLSTASTAHMAATYQRRGGQPQLSLRRAVMATAAAAEQQHCEGTGLARLNRRGLRQQSSPPPSSPSSSLPLWPPPVSSPDILAPAGRDPTGGLPRALANFTSCLWVLDFDRNMSSGDGDGSGAVLLDSVVIAVPHQEVVLLRWVWSRNSTAAVTDAALAEQLRDMLDRSILAAAPGRDGDGDGDGVSITFKTFYWCALIGRNVTVTSVWPFDAGPGQDVRVPLNLVLPVSYPDDELETPPAAAEPSLLPPPSSPPLWSNNRVVAAGLHTRNPWALYVAVICGMVAGLLVALLLCILVVCLVRHHRRRLSEDKSVLDVPSPSPLTGGAACAPPGGDPQDRSLHIAATAVIVCNPAEGSALPPPPESKTTADGKTHVGGISASAYENHAAAALAPIPAEEPGLVPKATAATAAPQPLSSAATDGGQILGTWCDVTVSGLGQLLANREFSDMSLTGADSGGGGSGGGGGAGGDGGGSGGGSGGGGAGGGDPAAAARGSQLAERTSSVTTHGTSAVLSATTQARTAVPSAVASTTMPSGDRSSIMLEGGMVAQPSANGQKREKLMLHRIALSLHTSIIRTRDAVAGGLSHVIATGAEPSLVPMGQWGSTVHAMRNAPHLAPETVDCPPVLAPAVTGTAAAGAGDKDGGSNGAVMTESGILMLTGELGFGAQGVVYSGLWRGLDVAVKSLRLHQPPAPLRGLTAAAAVSPSSGSSLESAAPPDLAQQRALREAAISVAASRHPNVVPTYHVDVGVLNQELPPLTTAAATAAAAAASTTAATSTATAATCWKMTMISQLCDGGTLRNALSSGLLARCSAHTPAGGTAAPPLPGLPSPETTTSTTAAAASGPTAPFWVTSVRKALPAIRSPDAATSTPTAAAAAAATDVGPRGPFESTETATATATSSPRQLTPLEQQQLQEHIQPQQLLQPRVLLLVALDVALGLMQLHGMNVVHGDVSSSNVLLVSRSSTAGAAAAAAFSSVLPSSQSRVATDPSSRGADATVTETRWLSNSSDALALLVDLNHDLGRGGGQQHMRFEDSNVGDTLAATAVALGVYGYVAKLCDFRLAEVLPQGQPFVSTPCRRSSAYTGPELALDGQLCPASDVYSWGVLCWELALGMPPALRVLVSECLRTDSAGRPTARDVVRRLEHIIASL
ncbi:hypothetical protein VaNZ11_000816 [Volvox africanus]|uniref:Protein kinase domain-containing protein n=1 Tax=Volvox africanus TaxID=51714 RepID=A0ABQ5RNG7_9CHLO|nr:hypothetical protein VaNZ11_000816 [Volvox africanus]